MGYEVIKELAKKKGKSLEYISEYAGISYNSLSKIIRNTIKAPKYATMKKIANALDMNTDELSYAIGMTDISPEDTRASFSLTQAEQNHMQKYRALDEHGKETVNIVLEHEHKRCVPESRAAGIAARGGVIRGVTSEQIDNLGEKAIKTKVEI